MTFSEADRARFWSKVVKGDGCWLWRGATIKQGYGNFFAQGKYLRAHRVAYIMGVGPIADGLAVCHRCDNPSCVNPAHLFLGTWGENLSDMTVKGRRSRKGAPGERNTKAKLTEDQVRSMRADRAAGMTISALMAKYGLGQTAVKYVIYRKTWAHVA